MMALLFVLLLAMSGDMLPTSTPYNPPDGALCDFKSARQGALGDVASRIQLADFYDLCIGKFCLAVSFPERSTLWLRVHSMSNPTHSTFRVGLHPMPSLLDHILHVVQPAANEEMFRADAWGIIAPVKNLHPIWDRAIDQFPGNSMGIYISAFEVEAPTAFRNAYSTPSPARPEFWSVGWAVQINFFPEAAGVLAEALISWLGKVVSAAEFTFGHGGEF